MTQEIPEDMSIRDQLATCRAIHFAMQNNQLTYAQAKEKIVPLLKIINDRLELFAKARGMKPQKISFYSLGSNL